MNLKKNKKEFIEQANKVHNNKYDYNQVDYINTNTKVCIICPVHGEFWQTPKHHLRGQNCPKCSKISSSFKRTSNIDAFVKKSKLIHGDRYNYSKVNYVNNSTKVCIICPVHGEFWQLPKNHLRGQNCPKCSGRFCTDTEYFIEKAKKVHGNKYDYSKVNYINNKTKVCIICTEHGEFWQTPQDHLQNKGCPICGIDNMKKSKTYSCDEFIKLSNKIHNNKYKYEKVDYVNSNTEVKITCTIHGDFLQKPYIHLQGFGCSKCSGKFHYDTEEFISKAKEIHGEQYDYSKVEYIDSHTKVCIICPEHGEFWQRPYEHLQNRGCPKCSHICSRAEQDIMKFIEGCNVSVISKNKDILNGKELDIYIPEKKIAIEYDGLIWHSEKFNKVRDYHLNKTIECEKQGIRLIHIFEDEWLKHEDIVKSKLKHILGLDTELIKIFGRKTEINTIDRKTAKEFLEKNHIQGYARSTIYLGCFYGNNLVGVMTFKRENKVGDKWELTRFATDITKHCIGVGGKLFKYFIRNYNPSEVKSFADRRWTTSLNNTLYDNLGFKLNKILKPDYSYVVNSERMHKFDFRKKRLLKKYPNKGLNLNMTEHEMCKKLGFYRIYNCGLIKYKWCK